ncbi:MAG: hypothetical protein KJ749_00220 [Planctomycetes bacterium]|nr:hypothetical protein [Planctomycetota bacterium]
MTTLYRIDLRNITVLPVEVVGFRFGDEPMVPASSLWADHRGLGVWRNSDGSIGINPSGLEEMRFSPTAKDRLILASFFASGSSLPAEWLPGAPGSMEVATRFPGQDDYRWSDVYVRPPRSARGSRPVEPTIEAALDKHGFLERTDNGGLLARPGTWDVTGDLILPEGVTLEVEPGTTLRFESGAILYATAAVQVRGTRDQPVVLEPQAESWGGLVVMGAEEQSRWEHATVRGTTGIERSGWMLTGGVTFQRSAATLTRVRFVEAKSEDALNVVHARVALEECAFSDCASDAFDGDFVSGSVDRCRFAGIGGDAVDISGSTLDVLEIRAQDVIDKVVSAGESSTVTIRDLEAKKAGIAIASKDKSNVSVVGAVIREAGIGLACYCKKPMFGPASITARQIELYDTARATLVQTGSSILLNGTEQPTESLDVQALYANADAK